MEDQGFRRFLSTCLDCGSQDFEALNYELAGYEYPPGVSFFSCHKWDVLDNLQHIQPLFTPLDEDLEFAFLRKIDEDLEVTNQRSFLLLCQFYFGSKKFIDKITPTEYTKYEYVLATVKRGTMCYIEGDDWSRRSLVTKAKISKEDGGGYIVN